MCWKVRGSTGRPGTAAASLGPADGFTLLELMVVLALLALLMGLVLPGLQRTVKKERDRANLRQLTTTLRLARSQAATTRQRVRVFVNRETGQYRLEGSKRPGVLTGMRLGETRLVWQDRSHRQGYIAFYGDGSSSGGKLALEDSPAAAITWKWRSSPAKSPSRPERKTRKARICGDVSYTRNEEMPAGHKRWVVLGGTGMIWVAPPGRRAADCQGFSLLEVLVATTLMGLVLVVLLQVLTGAMRAQEMTLEHARALQVAERALQESCTAMNLAAAQYQGQAGSYHYLVRVTPQYEVADQSLDRLVRCSLIQVTVSWQERGSKRSVSLETIRTAVPEENVRMRSRSKPPRGFTLLELVVALALTSLLTVVAYSSLNISLKAVGRGQVAAERLQELRVGRDILERSLSSTVRGSLADQTYFIGDPRQMRFFTLEPLEAYNLGGVYHWRVLLGQDEAGNGVLAVEQTKNVNWYRDPEGVEVRQIILSGVAEAHFTYGTGGEEFENWDAKKVGSLPEWVKVNLSLNGQQSLVLMIPIHVAEFRPIQR